MGTMRKRMLALLLALMLVVGLGEQAWAEVLPDIVSPSPEVSGQPEETTEPEETETAEETTVPEETGTPDQPEETQDKGTQEEPLADTASDAAALANAGTIDTVSPVGTTINLFDYWYSSPDESTGGFDDGESLIGYFYRWGNWVTGINQGHALKFQDGAEHTHMAEGKANWYSEKSTRPGLVENVLSDGYPKLNYNVVNGSIKTGTRLDGAHGNEVQEFGVDYGESLAYLFDPSTMNNSRDAYTDVKDLLHVSDDGYYTYNSADNFAEFHEETNSFIVYDQPNDMGVGYKGEDGEVMGQFFPFNTYKDGANQTLNHFMGLTMTTRFVQKDGGNASNGVPITYEFSGDDDVWVFIDGVLVGDLGGIHDAISLKIDFSTGAIFINNVQDGTLLSKFQDAKKDTSVGFKDDTFADDTYHTIQFFYLERGAGASNLMLKFNLVSVPESSIYKVDQTGNAVAGADFALYTATEEYEQRTLVAEGTTDMDGRIVLLDNEGFTISFQDLWNKMKNADLTFPWENGQTRANLLLEERTTPDGYRSGNTQKLYLLRSGNNIVMLSDDPWSNGTDSYTNSTVSMTGQFSIDGTPYDLEKDKGTLFAVVLRREKKDSPETDLWYLMTGSATDGWHQGTTEVNHNVQAVLDGVKGTQNYYQLNWDPSGAYKTTVTNLPGDIMKYYYMLDDDHKREAEYNIAFYYTTASSVSAATASNTWMVENTGTWTREFSSNVYVSNVKNRLFVQKLTPAGTGVVGAQFTLYGSDYLNGDGTVNTKAQPVDQVTTQNFNKDEHGVDLAGAGVFPTPAKRVLTPGTYYIVETAAPEGYDVNPAVTKVVVDDSGVYANAGEADDGIVVSRGVGSLVKSMAQFAALGDIDVTLNNIVARFYTVESLPSGASNFEKFVWRSYDEVTDSFVEAAGVTYHPTYWRYTDSDTYAWYDKDNQPTGTVESGMHLNFSAAAALEYGTSIKMVDGQQPVVSMCTDTGWSKLMIEQCLRHSQALVDEGKNVTDLTGRDLTNLFSGMVIVQVTAPHTTSITIDKQVAGLNADQVTDQTYAFTLEKMNGDQVDTDYKGTVSVQVSTGDGAEPQSQKMNFVDGVLTVSRTGTGQIQVLSLGSGTYRVTEQNPTSSIPVNGEQWYWQGASYQAQGSQTAVTTPVTLTVNSDSADTAANGVVITNTYQEDPILTVTKTVEGDMGDTEQDFTFTLEVSKDGTDYGQPIQAVVPGANGEATDKALTATDGTYSFTLKHGQTITMEIPRGYDATVTETTDQNYTISSCQYPTGASAEEKTKIDTQTVSNMQNNYTVEFLNFRNAEDVVITGVQGQDPAYLILMGVGGISGLAIFGCAFRAWHRRRRDWM